MYGDEPKYATLEAFIREIYDEDVMAYLCEDCYQERADDI